MKCPYCDSRVSPVPDNRVCPHCGGPLGGVKELQFPEPPLGKYKQTFGFMEIQECGLRFYEKFLLSKKDRFVPYSDLLDVYYAPCETNLGILCIRDKRSKYLPVPNTPMEASADMTSVIFTSRENERYRIAYEFLKQCAEIANKARE